MAIKFNTQNPFEDASTEDIAKFFVTQLRLLPVYDIENEEEKIPSPFAINLYSPFFQENECAKALKYKGSVTFFSDQHSTIFNKLDEKIIGAIKLLNDAYTLFNNQFGGITKGSNAIFKYNNGQIILELTSGAKDAGVDFPPGEILRCIGETLKSRVASGITQSRLSFIENFTNSAASVNENSAPVINNSANLHLIQVAESGVNDNNKVAIKGCESLFIVTEKGVCPITQEQLEADRLMLSLGNPNKLKSPALLCQTYLPSKEKENLTFVNEINRSLASGNLNGSQNGTQNISCR
jgi:hypothetical protein